ncbi:hypothetical protein PGT21_010299 [Puccinia graminis f. sp. tritici]|uniref:Uncharacterized protein n=1 Tax=Puccinia graminis f. sp. tritici TaxID=56615 RepID=A0A5B0LLL2_PUCGR|nr:hypothetical protein PGT21_010299 [Puccinia graminis f. sp. tritici]KAA1132344.1 hypothetical protein PGTUg99_005851 [Puccinia graminis f. sp. tritici]
MQEDWNSLRGELHGFYKSPQIWLWLEKQAADEQENDFGKKLEKLDSLHKSLGEDVPTSSKNTAIMETKFKEMEQRRKGYIEDLFNLIYHMRSDFSGRELESRYLYLQNLVFKTIYYFFKYQKITPEELQSHFKNHGTIKDLARHVFISYKLDQQVSIKLIPQSSKNVLNFWYYYPLREILEGLGEEYKEKFSTHYNKLGFAYYKMNPEYSHHPELHRILIECSTSLLNEDEISAHITLYDPDTQIYQV